FQVEIASAPAAPADVAGLARHDLVVLGEIPALDFSPSQLDALAAFVRDLGGGLLLLGGEQSLGPGGYARTAIEEVSPTAFDLKQERRRASLAEVIAVDFSGSMAAKAGEHTKLELANEAAVRSADLLGEGDRLGVLHVDAAPHWTVPLAPVVDKAKIAERIRAVGPGGGGIFVDLTLETAYAALRKETTQLKHLLLFADGSDAEERTRAPALVARAKAAGITTSVVALGSGKDVTALERLATLGGGRFYLIEDARRLPAVFAQETVLASRSAINEVRFVPAPRAAGPALRGIDFGAAPPLTGYVVTIPKNRAEVHLAGPEGDPVLATWSVGTGRAGVFTSDFSNRWGHAWTSWEGASRLFGQLSRQLARRAEDPRVRLQAEFENGGLAIRATALDARGRRDTFRRLRVVVSGPEGYQRTAPLEVIGPGHFGLELSPSRPGAYVMTLVDDVTGEPLATGGAVLASGIEQRPVGTDRALLGRVATLTGGKVRDTLAGIFRERERRRFAYSPLEPTLLATCAAALLLAVTARRLFVSIPRLRRATIERRSSASAASITGTLAALRARKRKARGEPAPPSEQTAEAAQPSAHEPSAGSPPRAATPAPKPPLRPPERGRTAAEILLERRRRRLR
ncbi:MAG: VWA domain-containing protein, partial [Pseudomonadota bacterium]